VIVAPASSLLSQKRQGNFRRSHEGQDTEPDPTDLTHTEAGAITVLTDNARHVAGAGA
jgi:hypothetical protein